MAIPVLVYRAVEAVFGLGSYWPFLLTTMIPHVGDRARRARAVSPSGRAASGRRRWSARCCWCSAAAGRTSSSASRSRTTCRCSGSSCTCCSPTTTGRSDRRDWLGVLAGAVGVHVVGVRAVLHRRHRPVPVAADAVGGGRDRDDPAGRDLAGSGGWRTALTRSADRVPGGKSQVAAFAVRGLTATFDGLVSFRSLAGLALFATLAVTVWRRHGRPQTGAAVAIAAVGGMMFLGVGTQRVGLGIETAAASRYVYMGGDAARPGVRARDRPAAPVVAGRADRRPADRDGLGRDQRRQPAVLRDGVVEQRRACEANVFSLLAGSPEQTAADRPDLPAGPVQPRRAPARSSRSRRARTRSPARPPANADEVALVAQALTAGNTVCLTPADLVPAAGRVGAPAGG